MGDSYLVVMVASKSKLQGNNFTTSSCNQTVAVAKQAVTRPHATLDSISVPLSLGNP